MTTFEEEALRSAAEIIPAAEMLSNCMWAMHEWSYEAETRGDIDEASSLMEKANRLFDIVHTLEGLSA